MKKKKHDVNDEYAAWEKLVQKFPDHPAFEGDTLYALPPRLIMAIEQRVPDLWNAADIEFEYYLTNESGMGFFLKKPFWFQPFEKCFIDEELKESKFEARHKRNEESLQQLTREILLEEGHSNGTVDHEFQIRQQYKIRAEERRLSYAGWLITSLEFQSDKIAFLEKWKRAISRKGDLPGFPKMKMVEGTQKIPNGQRKYYDDYIRFYSKWSLDSLATWDLALPMFSNPVAYSQYNEELLGEAGLSLFLPWYLLADKDLKLDEIVNHISHFKETLHLKSLLMKTGQANEKLGPVRNFSMLQMYIFLLKGLYDRYSKKLRGNLGRIDMAFTQFQIAGECSEFKISQKVDSTKKIRTKLTKALKNIDTLNQK